MTDCDVVVIGAGAAGLRCAGALQSQGRSVVVLEASDEVGGRVRTDRVDGFACDRGFQVLNPSYPQVREHVDTDRLRLGAFGAGLKVRTSRGLRTVADPVRAPQHLAQTLRSGLLSPRDLAGFARWVTPALTRPQQSLSTEDRPLGDELDQLGANGSLRHVFDRFIAGVLVESHGDTSANYTRILLRSFTLARPALPAEGMGAVTRQLAETLTDVRLNTRVEHVRAASSEGGDVTVTAAGAELVARAVVVAADPEAAEQLTQVRSPLMHGLTTWWYAAPEPPLPDNLLLVDGRGQAKPPGPVWNTAVVTNVAPSYAPGGRVLVQATTLLDQPDGDAPEADVRAHLASLYGCDTSRWEVVTQHRVPSAVPAQLATMPVQKSLDVASGVYVCGDHRDTASLQGALASGTRAAHAVQQYLSA